jgi:pimeloyl-ACP methyl ester carboxylesterase
VNKGLLGAAVGVVAAGAAVGLAAERYAVGRTRLRPDPDAREPFFELPVDRTRTVRTDDGVPLHVEEVGPADAPLTVVFVHGYVQQMAVWHYQRQALAADSPGRLVFYDQRSHGRSGRGAPETATIDQLGRDLHTVLSEVVPRGPVVLVGHSMGGMTIMALADAHPELFGPRVVAVALVATSTGRLAELTFGLPKAVLPVTRRVLPWVTRGMRSRPQPFERGRRVGTDLAFLLTRYGGFGDRDVSPAVVQFVEQMGAQTPVEVIAQFYDTFTTHDKLAALDVLCGVETLLLAGSKDLMTPLDHSRAMAEALPDAHLVVVEGAGHMVLLERPALVTLQLRALIARATRTAARSA